MHGVVLEATSGMRSLSWNFAKFWWAPDFVEFVRGSFSCFLHWNCPFKLHFLWRLNSQFTRIQVKNVKNSAKWAHPKALYLARHNLGCCTWGLILEGHFAGVIILKDIVSLKELYRVCFCQALYLRLHSEEYCTWGITLKCTINHHTEGQCTGASYWRPFYQGHILKGVIFYFCKRRCENSLRLYFQGKLRDHLSTQIHFPTVNTHAAVQNTHRRTLH